MSIQIIKFIFAYKILFYRCEKMILKTNIFVIIILTMSQSTTSKCRSCKKVKENANYSMTTKGKMSTTCDSCRSKKQKNSNIIWNKYPGLNELFMGEKKPNLTIKSTKNITKKIREYSHSCICRR